MVKWVLLVIGLVAAAVGVVLGSGGDLTPREKRVVRNWLECDECSDGELDSLLTLGSRARTALIAVLDSGPPVARVVELRGELAKGHSRGVAWVSAHPSLGPAPDSTTYVGTYVESFRRLYCTRAAWGLGALGGQPAVAALVRVASDSGTVVLCGRRILRASIDSAQLHHVQ
jgi:hypothetical protein